MQWLRHGLDRVEMSDDERWSNYEIASLIVTRGSWSPRSMELHGTLISRAHFLKGYATSVDSAGRHGPSPIWSLFCGILGRPRYISKLNLIL